MATKKKTTALSWIVDEAKSLKKKYPKRFATWKEYVAQASAIYASKHKGKSPVGKKKIASPGKTKVKPVVKAKKAPARSTHKDTKSHNVNIRVVSGVKKSKETLFHEILHDNDLYKYLNVIGKTYGKFYANVKIIKDSNKKHISPIVIEFMKKINNLPLKFTEKAIGKKSKHYEYIDGGMKDTYWQMHEYKISI